MNQSTFQNCKLIKEGNEFLIPLNQDGFISATEICKIAGKKVSNWLRMKEIKNKIKDDSCSLIKIITRGKDKHNHGT